MIKQLNEKVWFGNWTSIQELQSAKSVINVAHAFSVRRGRNIYWARLASMDWRVMYFRLALKDAHPVTDGYCSAFSAIVSSIAHAEAFPLLCHCQMGGHRGPSAALHASVLLGYDLEKTIEDVRRLAPGLGHSKRPGGQAYYESTVESLRKRFQ